MYKTIASLALLKTNWDTLKKDFIENFVPFVVTLINRYQYKSIDTYTICRDFKNEYGLTIPYHPMMTILDRTRKNGYIVRENGQFIPVMEKIESDDFSVVVGEQERKYNNIIDRFIRFCRENYETEVSEEDAENTLIAFIKEHDLDILFASKNKETLLPDVRSNASLIFLINTYVKHAHESEPEIFSFMVDISIGHIISSTLLYPDFDKFQGRLSGACFYLDIGFLFGVIGINGDDRKDTYYELIKLLTTHQAKLLVFKHTYDEFLGILETSLNWLESQYYDPLKASRALRYFKENEYSSTDVERFILGIDKKLSDINFHIIESPDPTTDKNYQIDEERLQEIIVQVYKNRDPYFDEEEKDFTLYLDVKSIAAINRLRRSNLPRSLEGSPHVFVTTNSSLAFANKLFETERVEGTYFYIPSVLTDIFVGTLIWIRSPMNISEISEKRLLANCYAALQPSEGLLKKLIGAAEKLLEEGEITQEEITLIKESRVARNLLQEETLGDPNRFTDQTITDILAEIRMGIRIEEQEKFEDDKKQFSSDLTKSQQRILGEQSKTQVEKEQHEETRRKLQDTVQEKESLEQNIEQFAKTVALVVSVAFYILTIGLVVLATFVQLVPNLISNDYLKYILTGIAAIFSVISIINGYNVKGTKDSLEGKIRDIVVRIFKK